MVLPEMFHQYIFFIISLAHALKLSVTEEGYDGGESPELLVNVTAVPLVSEILQVLASLLLVLVLHITRLSTM